METRRQQNESSFSQKISLMETLIERKNLASLEELKKVHKKQLEEFQKKNSELEALKASIENELQTTKEKLASIISSKNRMSQSAFGGELKLEDSDNEEENQMECEHEKQSKTYFANFSIQTSFRNESIEIETQTDAVQTVSIGLDVNLILF